MNPGFILLASRTSGRFLSLLFMVLGLLFSFSSMAADGEIRVMLHNEPQNPLCQASKKAFNMINPYEVIRDKFVKDDTVENGQPGRRFGELFFYALRSKTVRFLRDSGEITEDVPRFYEIDVDNSGQLRTMRLISSSFSVAGDGALLAVYKNNWIAWKQPIKYTVQSTSQAEFLFGLDMWEGGGVRFWEERYHSFEKKTLYGSMSIDSDQADSLPRYFMSAYYIYPFHYKGKNYYMTRHILKGSNSTIQRIIIVEITPKTNIISHCYFDQEF